MTCIHVKCAALQSLLVVVAMVSVSLSARAEEALPSQDQAVARALENHPEIVAAKAKVALVEAELYGKRIEVSRQVLGLYGSLKMLDAQIDATKASLEQARREQNLLDNRGAAGAITEMDRERAAGTVRAAEGKLVEAMGRREQAEKELRLLIGKAAQKVAETTFNIHSDWAGTPRQMPQSAAIDKWKTVEGKPIQLDFVDVPLEEVLAWLSEESGVKFASQRPALEEEGLDQEMPVTLSTNKVPLSAALQSFEDANPYLQFVLRDYGVLLTTRDAAEDNGYVPVLELDEEVGAAGTRR
jgi:hypothetical protein